MRKFLRATGLVVAVRGMLAACYPERPSQPNVYASITTVYDTLFRVRLRRHLLHAGHVSPTSAAPTTSAHVTTA